MTLRSTTTFSVLIWVAAIVIWTHILWPQEKVVYKTVIQPATDQQLVEFWFGNQDKTQLRNRICK